MTRRVPVVAVLSVVPDDRDALAHTLDTLVTGSPDAGGDGDPVAFRARAFAPEVAGRVVLFEDVSSLPSLIRVLSRAEGEKDSSPGGAPAEWLDGFTRDALAHASVTQEIEDADGLLVVLPRAPNADGGSLAAEAIATRQSLWLMLLLSELIDRNADGPVAFVVDGDARDRETYAREIECFVASIGHVPVFVRDPTLGDDLAIVKHFIDTLGSDLELASVDEPVLVAEPIEIVDPIPEGEIVVQEVRAAIVPAVPVPRMPARRRWSRVVVPAAGTAVVVAGLAAGFGLGGFGKGDPLEKARITVAARDAVRAALTDVESLTIDVRRARLTHALTLCTKPSAGCALDDVLKLGEELKRLRKPAS